MEITDPVFAEEVAGDALTDPEKNSDKAYFLIEDAKKILNGEALSTPQFYVKLRNLYIERRFHQEKIEIAEKFWSGCLIRMNEGTPQTRKSEVDSDDDIFKLRSAHSEQKRRTSEVYSYILGIGMLLKENKKSTEEDDDENLT